MRINTELRRTRSRLPKETHGCKSLGQKTTNPTKKTQQQQQQKTYYVTLGLFAALSSCFLAFNLNTYWLFFKIFDILTFPQHIFLFKFVHNEKLKTTWKYRMISTSAHSPHHKHTHFISLRVLRTSHHVTINSVCFCKYKQHCKWINHQGLTSTTVWCAQSFSEPTACVTVSNICFPRAGSYCNPLPCIKSLHLRNHPRISCQCSPQFTEWEKKTKRPHNRPQLTSKEAPEQPHCRSCR